MRLVSILGLAAAVVAAGCSSSNSPSPQHPSAVNNSIADSAGDTMNPDGSVYDILGVATSRTGPAGGGYTTIQVSVKSAAPALLPPPGTVPDGTQVAGSVGFDVDGNLSDGSNFGCTSPSTTYSFDYAVDMVASGGRLVDGNHPINIYSAAMKVGEATPSVNGNTLSLTIPIASIGNRASDPFNLGMELGNGIGPTDCAPNSGHMTSDASRQ